MPGEDWLLGGPVGCEFFKEDFCKFAEFFLSPAGDCDEVGFGCWGVGGHAAEGGVTEDDVGGDSPFVGKAFAEDAESFEQRGIGGERDFLCDVAFASAGFGGCERAGEVDHSA